MKIGTPLTKTATKILLCGAGELGKEVAIELQRLGTEVIAIDRYEHAPAMQVAHRSYTLSMTNGEALRKIIMQEQPDLIIPEIEAIATNTLVELESEGFTVVPTARAVQLTMNREGIRQLAAETLNLPTSNYQFAETLSSYHAAVDAIGLPCVVKPIMSSSGKGQTIVRTHQEIDFAWQQAQQAGRVNQSKVIVESLIDFDYEITLLTIRHKNGISFCEPIGHYQEAGDYQESWQPHPMPENVLHQAQEMATKVTEHLGGWGLFGVEFFIKQDQIYFSEVSPRPHDTGLVTLISQDLSEFALHVRAILGLPIPNIHFHGPSASKVIIAEGKSNQVQFHHLETALNVPNTQLRLFGKPSIDGKRRMGVIIARGKDVSEARKRATQAVSQIKIEL